MSSIAFSRYIKVVSFELEKLLVERLQKLIHVFANLFFINDILIHVIRIGKSGTSRLVNEQNIGVLVTSMRIEQNSRLIHSWPLLEEHGKLRAAPRATGHPQHERVIHRIITGFKKTEKDVATIINFRIHSNTQNTDLLTRVPNRW